MRERRRQKRKGVDDRVRVRKVGTGRAGREVGKGKGEQGERERNVERG